MFRFYLNCYNMMTYYMIADLTVIISEMQKLDAYIYAEKIMRGIK